MSLRKGIGFCQQSETSQFDLFFYAFFKKNSIGESISRQ